MKLRNMVDSLLSDLEAAAQRYDQDHKKSMQRFSELLDLAVSENFRPGDGEITMLVQRDGHVGLEGDIRSLCVNGREVDLPDGAGMTQPTPQEPTPHRTSAAPKGSPPGLAERLRRQA